MFTSGEGGLWTRDRRNLEKVYDQEIFSISTSFLYILSKAARGTFGDVVVGMARLPELESESDPVNLYLIIFLLSPKLYTKKFTLLLKIRRR